MKVFLSHSTTDKPFVRKFNQILNAIGIDTFLDERDIELGEQIPTRIYKEIEKADYIFYFISKSSINSKWVEEELSIAKMKEKRDSNIFILPILIDDLAQLPFSFIDKRCADFHDRIIDIEADNFKLVINALKINTKTLYKSINNIKNEKVKDSIIAILSTSSELQINLNDIIYLAWRAINIKDHDRNYRILTIRDEVAYRDINSKLRVILQEMSKLNEVDFLTAIINDLIARIKKFLIFNSKIKDLDLSKKVEPKLLLDFQEATIAFNRRLSQFHFQLVVIMFNLKVTSLYKP